MNHPRCQNPQPGFSFSVKGKNQTAKIWLSACKRRLMGRKYFNLKDRSIQFS